MSKDALFLPGDIVQLKTACGESPVVMVRDDGERADVIDNPGKKIWKLGIAAQFMDLSDTLLYRASETEVEGD